MKLGRTIVVMIVACAVALLPAVGGAVRADEAITATTVSSDPCCEHSGKPCDQHHRGAGDCASLAGCAAKCFNFSGLLAGEVTYVPAGRVSVAVTAAAIFASHTDPPPSPPPRV